LFREDIISNLGALNLIKKSNSFGKHCID